MLTIKKEQYEWHHVPFLHAVIKDVFPKSLIEAARIQWPDKTWEHWHNYSSPESNKLASKDTHRMPPACNAIFNHLCELDVGPLLGLREIVFPDYSGHAAGMHWLLPGGYLQPHIDALQHPQTGWTRKLSVCLYLDDCPEAPLLLYSLKGEVISKSIKVKKNTAVIFECNEESYHGIPKGPELWPGRRSLSCFFWGHPTEEELNTSAKFKIGESNE